jgi:hypothetical protein
MSYSQQLKDLTTDAQLHLWFFKLSQRPRRTSVKTANATLVKWLKPQVKRQRYKLIKQEIKTLISIGRKKDTNLESKLVELYQIEVPQFENDNEIFCAVCRSVEKALNVTVSLVATIDEVLADQSKGCFVIAEDITTHFNSDHYIEKPIKLAFRSVSKGQLAQVMEFFEGAFDVLTEQQLKGVAMIKLTSKTGCSK